VQPRAGASAKNVPEASLAECSDFPSTDRENFARLGGRSFAIAWQIVDRRASRFRRRLGRTGQWQSAVLPSADRTQDDSANGNAPHAPESPASGSALRKIVKRNGPISGGIAALRALAVKRISPSLARRSCSFRTRRPLAEPALHAGGSTAPERFT